MSERSAESHVNQRFSLCDTPVPIRDELDPRAIVTGEAGSRISAKHSAERAEVFKGVPNDTIASSDHRKRLIVQIILHQGDARRSARRTAGNATDKFGGFSLDCEHKNT